MITFFSIPKAFKNNIEIIQRNAIRSWINSGSNLEVILFGDDQGVREVAHEFSLRHFSNIERNKNGTPYISGAFSEVQKVAAYETLCYANCDIIFLPGFINTVQKILEQKEKCLLVGRRWDLDVAYSISFRNDWQEELMTQVKESGRLHGFSGIDFFVFNKGLISDMPPFLVGRPGWDNWLIYYTRSKNIPVIDITLGCTIIHQNHDHSHCVGGRRGRDNGPEARENYRLTNWLYRSCTILDADWIYSGGKVMRPHLLRRVWASISLLFPIRLFFVIRRNIRNKVRSCRAGTK